MVITLKNEDICFNISSFQLRRLLEEVSKKGERKELGGTIYGYKLKEIEEYRIIGFTFPFSKDICTSTNFYRKDKRHVASIRKAHNKDVKIMYLGEWHSHPVNNITPSSLDYHTWNNLSMNAKTSANRLIFLIVTNSRIGFSLYNRRGTKLHENILNVDDLLD